MINPTPNETSPNLYESLDGQVAVRILDQPQRYPKHDYKMVVIRFIPKDHTRIRHLGGNIYEYMPTKEEIHALLKGMQTDPDFQVEFKRPMVNKPEERKLAWQKFNQYRTRRQRFVGYRRTRRYCR